METTAERSAIGAPHRISLGSRNIVSDAEEWGKVLPVVALQLKSQTEYWGLALLNCLDQHGWDYKSLEGFSAGRLIPSFFIFERSVLGCMFNFSAAPLSPLIFQ